MFAAIAIKCVYEFCENSYLYDHDIVLLKLIFRVSRVYKIWYQACDISLTIELIMNYLKFLYHKCYRKNIAWHVIIIMFS